MVEDRKLTDHFTLYELTKTNRKKYRDENRAVTKSQIEKLTELAKLLENVRRILGTRIIISSGYRCPGLNKDIGSNRRSQHLKCEAADFVPESADIEDSFNKLWEDVNMFGSNVGQLIIETANRGYGVSKWLHISLGVPYRDKSRCNQILRMENGVYTRLA